MTNRKKSLYVGCALTQASDEFKGKVEYLKDDLRGYYNVMDFVGDKPASPGKVYQQDIEECVVKCDVMLAIADYPSIGLGWEMATAASLRTPTLAVAQIGRVVTRLMLGAAEVLPTFEFERYEDLSEVKERLGQFMARHLLATASATSLG